jgi:hypothetical protein
MKSVVELVKEINGSGVCTPHWVVEEVDFGDAKEVATIDMDEHRWYVVGTVVYSVGDEFIGVRGPVSLKSESMGYDDTGVGCEAFEMEAVPSVTYKRKLATDKVVNNA